MVTVLFFMWGFITVLLDPLVPRLKELFELSYFEAGLAQFAFFLAYMVFSIPAGGLLSKIGYKKGMVFGLLVMAIGCSLFYPAASYRMFSLFLLANFTLAAGMTLLQVAANPYVAVLGPEPGASSRLNLSQAFNSLGTTLAPIVGAMFILSDSIKDSEEIAKLDEVARETYLAAEAAAVQTPFIALAVALFVLSGVVAFAKLPVILSHKGNGGYGMVLRNPRLMFGAVGIFVYVGAEVTIGTYLTNYFIDMGMAEEVRSGSMLSWISELINHADLGTIDDKAVVGAFVTLYWGGAMVGRFIGAWLTNFLMPFKVLATFATLAILLVVISAVSSGAVAFWTILSVGFFNSIMFPTIFTISIEGLGEFKPQGSGILVTAIVGGAVVPPLYGYLTDGFGFNMAFIAVLCCYLYILFFSIYSNRIRQIEGTN